MDNEYYNLNIESEEQNPNFFYIRLGKIEVTVDFKRTWYSTIQAYVPSLTNPSKLIPCDPPEQLELKWQAHRRQLAKKVIAAYETYALISKERIPGIAMYDAPEIINTIDDFFKEKENKKQ